VVMQLLDVLSERVLCLAPLSAKWITNEATEASSRQLGTKKTRFLLL
jgi:hypothetical protein